MRLGLEVVIRLRAVNADYGIVFGGFAERDRFMRQIGQLQHQRVARRFGFGGLLVERGDFFAQILGLGFFGLGLGEFFLAHQRADFLAHAVAQGFERFHFGQGFAALFVQLEQFVNFGLVPCPARGQALSGQNRFFRGSI